MYNFFVDVIIWSFAIYGGYSILNEFALQMLCGAISYIDALQKKIIAKIGVKMYNGSRR